MIVERFAPSPTGLLHLGHAYSALLAWECAKAAGGRFLVRIENTDVVRCKPDYETALFEDLEWLGIDWENPILRQSDRLSDYNKVLKKLIDIGLCYPCRCTRSDIKNALSAPQEGAESAFGPDGVIYPRTCKQRSMLEQTPQDAIRLDMTKAVASLTTDLKYREIGGKTEEIITIDPQSLITDCGDIVLARKDIATTAYHMSVVLDDAFQDVTHVTRGQDLASATPIHCLLQNLLGLPTPIYRHHRLIRDDNGKRLAKRDDARSIRAYREQGLTPQDIREMVGLSP